ncbi:MAG: response regulator [Proteobacteria bacterium]|nr:response regulator [Pseudomonadota bacterium]MBU1611411.1 response regulator [Pseudomonadota bacterium]
MTDERKFLLVDDQEEINLLMMKILSPYGSCIIATNGPEAIDFYTQYLEMGQPFSAVFLDIMMPGMDGHEVADKLRQVERESGIKHAHSFKLIMITALSDTKNVCKSFFRGGMADAYITKPIKKDKLLDELKILKVI